MVSDLEALFHAALDAVSASATMPKALPATPDGRLVVIALGKAAAAMMHSAQALSVRPLPGLVITRHGHVPPNCRWPGVDIIEAGHPVPDDTSLGAGKRTLELARRLGVSDHLLMLVSGGGSALLAAPAPGLTLSDKQAVTRSLLQSGATITEINCVRKHLSRIKGGRLAVAAYPARVSSWIISDVPGDDASFVSSGPTIADPTSLAMARDILNRYRIDAPASIVAALDDTANETPGAETGGLCDQDIRIIACNRDALAAAERLAVAKGYAVTNLGDQIEGISHLLGREHAAIALRLANDGRCHAIISGGETSVRVTNTNGRGGRNLEYLLGLAIALEGAPGIFALACDTDGIDGTEAAAGAIVTPDTLARAMRLQLDPQACLAANNAGLFFQALGDLVTTGPTLTNVNDFRAILVADANCLAYDKLHVPGFDHPALHG